MRRPLLAAASAAAALLSIALAPSAGAAPSDQGVAHRNVHVCAAPAAGMASCHAIRNDRLDAHGKPARVSTTVRGFTPTDIRSAYKLTSATSGGQTVAIVDAYDDPYAASDLAKYRSTFGLSACGAQGAVGGCLTKVGQTGGAVPAANASWSQEISLDLDMVSAACPDCNILLVEATSPSFANLGAAVNYAATQGVVAISNSYGGSDSAATSDYDHPDIAITASTGDNGYQVQSPASFPGVVAVGGTSLKKASTARGWSESAWSGAGSGCSTINAKPTWQTAATQCGNKANADVSAVADPNTGVAVYDSYSYQGSSGWLEFGGTSASSPIIASVYAQGTAVAAAKSQTASSGTTVYPQTITWSHSGDSTTLNDVTSGSNGTCSPSIWCTSGSGWDGPTGLGTPNGFGAF